MIIEGEKFHEVVEANQLNSVLQYLGAQSEMKQVCPPPRRPRARRRPRTLPPEGRGNSVPGHSCPSDITPNLTETPSVFRRGRQLRPMGVCD